MIKIFLELKEETNNKLVELKKSAQENMNGKMADR